MRRWKRWAEIDDGIVEGLTTAEQYEVILLRRGSTELRGNAGKSGREE